MGGKKGGKNMFEILKKAKGNVSAKKLFEKTKGRLWEKKRRWVGRRLGDGGGITRNSPAEEGPFFKGKKKNMQNLPVRVREGTSPPQKQVGPIREGDLKKRRRKFPNLKEGGKLENSALGEVGLKINDKSNNHIQKKTDRKRQGKHQGKRSEKQSPK